VSQQIGFGLTMSVNAQNLIDLPAQRTQGGVVVQRVGLGRTLTLGLGLSL
jgi:hypothetical protein